MRVLTYWISYSPAGLEDYFFEVGVPFEGELPAKPNKQDIEKLMEAAPRYGIEFMSGDEVG